MIRRRLIKSGGGECGSYSLGSLTSNSNLQLPEHYTHVFLDPQQCQQQRLSNLRKKLKDPNVRFLSYKFLFVSIKNGFLSHEEDHVFRGKTRHVNKRPMGEKDASEGRTAKKMRPQETVVVTISDDDEENFEDCEIVEAGPTKAPTQTKTHVPTVMIDDDVQICEEEDDEDIEVLEELLARNSEGTERRYVERRKARSVKDVLGAKMEAVEVVSAESSEVERERSLTPPMEVDVDRDREEREENEEDLRQTDPEELEKGACEDEDTTAAVPSEVGEEENFQENSPAPELLYSENISYSLDEDSEEAASYKVTSSMLAGGSSEQSKDSEPAQKEAVGKHQDLVFSSADVLDSSQMVKSSENAVGEISNQRSEKEGKVAAESPPPSDQSSILNRILSTLMKRYKTTDEGLAIANINSRTPRYDKHREGLPHPGVIPLKHIEQDFRTGYDGERILNVTSSLRRLSLETSSTYQPTAYLLNVVLSKLLLHGDDDNVKSQSKIYLEKFLFLHLTSSKREEWLWLVLSACRSLEDQKSFRKFDMTNTHDLHSCWQFFSDTVNQVIEDYDGCEMFLAVFVKILHKDFEFWWKHCKDDFPILYYLLGGSESNILKKMDRSVLKLYQASLQNPSMLTQVRKILSMSALLLSRIDSTNCQVSINSGMKLKLAEKLSSVLETSQLSSRELYIELYLLQPAWLSALVCQNLLRSLYDISASRSLREILQSETAQHSQDRRLQYLLELTSSKICSFQQAHTIFRANWFYVRSPQREFKIFKNMKLDEEEYNSTNKMIKYEEVGVKLATIVENVNTIRNVANNKSEEINGSISALFFKMKLVDKF